MAGTLETDGRLPLPPELSPRRGGGSGRPARSGRRRAARVASWFAVVVSVLVLALSAVGFVTYVQLKGNIKAVGIHTNDGNDPKAASDGAENVLLVGDDSRVGLSQAEQRALDASDSGDGNNTDTIILMHLAPNGGPATLVSIPRDSYVPIPGHGTFKINSAYADGEADQAGGGPALLTQTVENLTGVHIDHYVQVGLGTFVQISNAIGGVQVCVENPDVSGHGQYDGGAYDPYSGTMLTPGVHTISGVQALEFVRQRHNLPNGDFDRIHRQQRFITAVEQKATTVRNPATIRAVLETATKSLTVDSGLKQGLNLADLAQRLKSLKPDQIKFATIPVADPGAVGTLPNGQQVDYVELDQAKVQSFFANLQAERDPNAPATSSSAPSVTPASAGDTRVVVENGAGVAGLAARTASSLTGYGFQVESTGNATVTSTTSITYNPADADQAAELARAIPGATLTSDSSAQTGSVTLVLGSGFAGAQDPATASATPSTPASSPSTSASNGSGVNDDTTSAADLNTGTQSIDGVACGP